jgi:putative ABC transport system ATP-binding protein
MALIDIRNVYKIFQLGDEEVVALNDVSFTIERGEFIAIVGPSGSGKSTLMHVLGCLEIVTRGDYFFEGVNINSFHDSKLAYLRNKKIGFVFQSYNLLSQYNVVQNVALPLLYAGVLPRERTERSIAALRSTNLVHRNKHRPSELSGGERQRVAIARAIVNSPEIILADEPTGNLDQRVGREIIAIFKQLSEDKGVTVIIVTHDSNIAQLASRRIEILDGKITRDTLQ